MKRALIVVFALVAIVALCGAAAPNAVYFVGDSHVRTGPGMGYDSIGVAQAGDKLGYSGSVSRDNRGVDWYMVSYYGRQAWVSSKYCSLMYSEIFDEDYTVDEPDGAVIATGTLNIRTRPDVNAPSIGTVPKGTVLPMNGSGEVRDNRGVVWYNVNYNGRDAWVSSKYADLY